MAHIVNGKEILRDSDRDYEYNGSTDRYYDAGPTTIKHNSYSDDVVREMDAVERKEKEAREAERSAEEYKQQREYDRTNWELYGKQERASELEKERTRRENQEYGKKVQAYKKAKENYEKQSLLYKMTHKKPTLAMSTEELDEMYQGRSR